MTNTVSPEPTPSEGENQRDDLLTTPKPPGDPSSLPVGDPAPLEERKEPPTPDQAPEGEPPPPHHPQDAPVDQQPPIGDPMPASTPIGDPPSGGGARF